GRGSVIEFVGYRKAEVPRHDGAFGHRAVGRARAAEEHPSPVVEGADAIDAADEGKSVPACEMRTPGEVLIDGLQRCGAHVYHRLAVDRNRVGKWLEPGR